MELEENFVKKCFNELVEKYDFLEIDPHGMVINFKYHKGFQICGYCLRLLSYYKTVAYGGNIEYDNTYDYLKFSQDITLKNKNVNFTYLEKLILKSKTQIDKLILKIQLNELEQEFNS